jgi:hydroxyacylglutathione hydrolase
MPKLRAAIVPVTPFQQNCTVLWADDSKRGAVVDPGGEAERVLRQVTSHGVTVEAILLTHGHLDHAGGVAALKRLLAAQGQDVPVIGPHKADAFLLASIARQAAMYGLDGMEDAVPDRYLDEGETLEIGGVPFEVLHCPGHTPGHLVYIARHQALALVGDVLFQGSIGRTDFPYGDHAALLRSIATKLLPLGDDIRFIPGHGEASTFGRERTSNPFLADLPAS